MKATVTLAVGALAACCVVHSALAADHTWEAEDFVQRTGQHPAVYSAPLFTTDANSVGYTIDTAYGGFFVGSRDASGAVGIVVYSIHLPVSGDWYFWGRAIGPPNADDSFFWAVDMPSADTAGEGMNIWDFNEAVGASNNFPFGDPPPEEVVHGWAWYRVSSRSGPFVGSGADPEAIALSAGPHSFHLATREDGAYMDAFFATTDPTLSPNDTPPTAIEPGHPRVFIEQPAPWQALPVASTEAQLRVRVYDLPASGHWNWRLDEPFPASGPAGGTPVLAGNTATISGLINGESYTVWVALVDGDGNLLNPSRTAAVTFSVQAPIPTMRYEHALPEGLSLFSPVYRAILLDGGSPTIDTRPTGILWARHLVQLGSTVVIRLRDGAFDAVIGRHGALLYGTDYPIEADQGYVVNMLDPTAFTVEGIPYGLPIEAAPASPAGESPPLWAFAVAGAVSDADILPPGARIRVVNRRTGEAAGAPIDPDVCFIVAVADLGGGSLVAEHDLLTVQLLAIDGHALGQPAELRVGREEEDLRRAFATVAIDALPARTRILPNFPNPFNLETWIPFELREPSDVTIRIYTPAGALIRELHLGRQNAGYHVAQTEAAYWDGRTAAGEPVASGVYLCALRSAGINDVRRLSYSRNELCIPTHAVHGNGRRRPTGPSPPKSTKSPSLVCEGRA